MTKPLIGLICLLVLFITVACSSPPAEDTPTPTAAPATQTPIPPTVPNVQPQGTPIPAPSAPPPAATITPANLVALFDLRIRSGPGIEYPITDKFAKDEQAVILGRTAAGDLWYRIACPARLSAEECWVIGDPKVVRTVNAQNIAVAAAPPLSTTPATATPTPCVPDPPSDWTQYTIVAGDTLSGLANQSAGSIAQLQAVNCLESDTIVAGSRIYMPRPAVANVDGESGATGSALPASAAAASSPQLTGELGSGAQPGGGTVVMPPGNTPRDTAPESAPTTSSADGTPNQAPGALTTPQPYVIDFTTTPPSGVSASLYVLSPTPIPCDARDELVMIGTGPSSGQNVYTKGERLHFQFCRNNKNVVATSGIHIVGPNTDVVLPDSQTSWLPTPDNPPGQYKVAATLDDGTEHSLVFQLKLAEKPIIVVTPNETVTDGHVTVHLFGFGPTPPVLSVYAGFTPFGDFRHKATITTSAAIFNESQEGTLVLQLNDAEWPRAVYLVSYENSYRYDGMFSVTTP